jgi:MFS family permease
VTPERVIRTYLVLAGISTLSASLIWGVNTLFLLDAGLDIAEVFLANAAFTAGMVVFEIPTGVVADTLGRRVSFLLSIATLAVATTLYVIAGLAEAGVGAFVVASVLLGLGFTFASGATEAWLVDALAATGYEHRLDDVFSRAQMVTAFGMLAGTLAGGVLGTIDLAIPFVLRATLLVPVFVIAFALMHDIGFQPRPLTRQTVLGEVRDVARASVRHGWRRREVRLLLLVPFVQYAFFLWGWYAWQPYFLDLLDTDAVWVAGVISACLSLATMAGNALVGPVTRLSGLRTTVLLWAAAVETLAAVAIGLGGSFALAFAALAVYSVASGVFTPVKQAYLHESIPTEQRATLVSFDSLLGNVGAIGGQVGLGYVSRARGIADGYVLGGAATVLVLPIVFALRRMRGDADRMGPCPPSPSVGRGLPAATTPRDVAFRGSGCENVAGSRTFSHPEASLPRWC